MNALGEILEKNRLLVCCGPGGVGKTTTSAALGLLAARQGKRVLVLTIDPARRLADALGMHGLDNNPQPLPKDLLEKLGHPLKGELHALMLDPKATFDDLIKRLAPSPEVASMLLRNRLYRLISEALAGTLEYTAVERLFELYHSETYDLIVLDTPPSRNVVDFLDAPNSIARFLDERILRWFLATQGTGNLFLRHTGKVVSSLLGKILGASFLDEIAEFFTSLGAMANDLRFRAESIQKLLLSTESLFLIVAAPEQAVIDDALYLCDTLKRDGFPFGGFIVNRVNPLFRKTDAIQAAQELVGEDSKLLPLAERLLTHLEELISRGAADRKSMERLRHHLPGGLVLWIPRIHEGIADLAALARLGDSLLLASQPC